ncbi:hypothetical protein O181_106069 [Austropuccinia psidii MF-1]|uniref:F5/8 type C domain-containing protein n=1 Tax=Austropuccinia psidii MF-1 TaxID=1389203 RepID=A0A9Q3JQN1_9BASI|nr:hypothetical protein [Austropuccinia psidii MF-1]
MTSWKVSSSNLPQWLLLDFINRHLTSSSPPKYLVQAAATVSQIFLSTRVRSENTTWNARPFISCFSEVGTGPQCKSSPFLPSSPMARSILPPNNLLCLTNCVGLWTPLLRTMDPCATTAGRRDNCIFPST